jgi:lipoprotein-releasing system permease protein
VFQAIKTVAGGRIRLALALLSLAPSMVAAAAGAQIMRAQDTTPGALVERHVIASSGAGTLGALVRGMTPAEIAKLMSNANEATSRSLQDFDSGKAVVIGRRLAEQLSLRAGDSITLVVPRGLATAGAAPLMKTYTVAAVLGRDRVALDGAIVLMTPPEAGSYRRP